MENGVIYCVGRNYSSHAKELGNTVPDKPMIFFKPDGALVSSGPVKLPAFSNEVHYETEVAFRFGPKLEISELAIANDLTARDVQRECQKKGQPWSLAKGFIHSCGIGNFVPSHGLDLKSLEFKSTLNGKPAQHGFTRDMIFDFETLITFLKSHFPIAPGDIVLTGTPEGVGPVRAGDVLEMEICGLSKAQFQFE